MTTVSRFGLGLSVCIGISALSVNALAQTGVDAPSQIKHIVVLPIQIGDGINKKNSALLNEVLLSEMASYIPSSTKLISSVDVMTVLGHEQSKQLLSCDDSSCMVEIGQALGASHLVSVTLGQIGDRYAVSAKLIDARQAAVLFRKVDEFSADDNQITAALRRVAAEICSSQGFAKKPSSAKKHAPSLAADTTTPPATEAQMSSIEFTGLAVAGVGAVLALATGVGTLAMLGVANDAAADYSERRDAAGWLPALGVGNLVGLVGAVAGVLLVTIVEDSPDTP